MRFNKWEKRTVAKMLEVFFPPGVGERLNRDPVEAGAVERLDYLIYRYPIEAKILFHFTIWILYWAPIFYLISPLPFNFLNWQKRKKVIEKMFYSKNYYIRSFANLYKLVSALAYFADTETRNQVKIPDIKDPIYQQHMGG